MPPVPDGSSNPGEFVDRLGAALAAQLGEAETVAVSVSGGVDSTVLLWLAARMCRRQGRRLVPVTVDVVDDAGGSPAAAARRLLDRIGVGERLRVVEPEPGRWPEPPWVPDGPRFDAWPRYRRGVNELAAEAGAGVLVHGTGADELLTAPRHLLAALARRRGPAAAWRYLRQRRQWGETEVEHLPALLVGRLRGPTAGMYWALSWPRYAADTGSPTLGPAMRPVARAWARRHRSESLRAACRYRTTWAQAAAMHALFPRDRLPDAGPTPERYPFLHPSFARYAYHLPLPARLGFGGPTAYLDHKHLIAGILPNDVRSLLPPRRLPGYASYQVYWGAMPAATPHSVELGLLHPDWTSRCRDAQDRAVAISVEQWIRDAVDAGAQPEREEDR